MLKNNNTAVITKMAKNSLISSKGKNAVLILAVMLSAFMLFTILTVGGTWVHMQKVQELHLQGGEYDAFFYGGFTKEQAAISKNHPEISAVGIEGMAGWGIRTEHDSTLHSAFIWADGTQWEKIMKPAREWVRGEYPQKDNEVMATREVLEDCGMGNLDIGDSFVITYGDNLGEHTKEFVITGMWEGYGDTKTFYVSKTFFDQSGYTLEDYGRAFMHLQLKHAFVTDKRYKRLERDLKLDKKQRLLLSSTASDSMLYLLLGMIGLIGITCLSAYLLIYNIMYLSVSGNIRYYGLLQMIGMTPEQVRQMVKKEMQFVGAIGIGAGLLLGIFTSFGVIPAIVKVLGVREKNIEISFHPLVICLSILFAVATLKIGGRKPVKMAAVSSPMEALGYQGTAVLCSRKRKVRRIFLGSPIWRMALKRICRDKKKAAMVVCSLGISLSVFLCMVTLIESQGARTIVSNYMETDMVISNDTMQMEEKSKWKPLIDNSFLEKLKADEAIQEIHPILNEEIIIPWEADFIEYWMTNFYDMWMGESYEDVKEDYQKHPGKYYSFLIGIDRKEFRYLNSVMENKVKEADFLAGKTCILYENTLGLDFKRVRGKKVSYYLSDHHSQTCQMTIQGMVNDSYYANLLGTTPTLIVSNQFLKGISKNPYISKVSIQYRQEYDMGAEGRIKGLIEASKDKKDFSYSSKIEELQMVKRAQGNMMEIGMGIVLLLAFIGIMNYVNTSVSNLQSSQMELSVMESIGMSQVQLRKLLVREGFLYALMALVFAVTAGLSITYYLYQSMNYRGIPFQVPVMPVLAAVFVIMLLCIMVPLIAYRRMEQKETLVERIRGFE